MSANARTATLANRRTRVTAIFAALAMVCGGATSAYAIPDYRPDASGSWTSPVVVRNTPDATTGVALYPAVLTGDATGYFSAQTINAGTTRGGQPILVPILLDGTTLSGALLGPIDAGARDYTMNFLGFVSGGLHTAGMLCDAAQIETETDESNNAYARQLTFQPVALPMGSAITRNPPPLPSGGNQGIVGTQYPNQDGVRVQSQQSWQTLALTPPAGQDYDLYLYAASSGINDGFRTPIKSSLRGAGQTDFIIANDNFVGSPPRDVGIQYFSGTFQSYTIEHRQPVGLQLHSGDTIAGLELADNQMIAVLEYQHVPNPSAPRMLFELFGPPGQVLHVALFSGLTSMASRAEAIADATTDASGSALLDVPLETTGGVRYYGVVVYRDQSDGGTASATYALSVGPTPADLANVQQPGRTLPVNATNGASNWTTDPTVLNGNVANTNMSFYYSNTGAQSANGYQVDTRLDGKSLLAYAPGMIAPGGILQTAVGPLTVRGGRHTLSYVLDLNGNITETSETNNRYGRQFVWTPFELASNNVYVRAMPPDPLGGHDAIPANVGRYRNCDGLRTDPTPNPPAPNGLAPQGGFGAPSTVVAVLPTPGTDVDLDAFLLPSESSPFVGFDVPIAQSERGTDLIDLIVDCNPSLIQTFDIGVRRFVGTDVQGYAVENVYSQWVNANPTTIGPDVLPPGAIVKAFTFQRIGASPMAVILDNLSGDADLGMSVYPASNAGPVGILQTLPGGFADAMGGGLSEGMLVNTASAPNEFTVVVWKKSWSEFTKNANFQLRIDPVTTDAPAALPGEIAFTLTGGNPVSTSTRLRFDLPRDANVSLDVLDLQGRRVRTLASGAQTAGSHTVNFDSRDESGVALRNGTYFVRFASEDVVRVKKVVVVR